MEAIPALVVNLITIPWGINDVETELHTILNNDCMGKLVLNLKLYNAEKSGKTSSLSRSPLTHPHQVTVPQKKA